MQLDNRHTFFRSLESGKPTIYFGLCVRKPMADKMSKATEARIGAIQTSRSDRD
jgi:hypothetical protein